ncbi:MAG TPA: PAS domain S-box protein, partial [Chitinophagaceae bacterium]|nr:PAS domain S-box protein [Chitinophagaceae bacterium]
MLNQDLRKETLRQSEEQHHRMVEEIEDYAIILLDRDGYIQNWNKGAEKIKGYKPEEIIGKNFRQFYTEGDRRDHLPERLLNQAVENGRATHEGWRVRKDGTLFWGNIVITALHDDTGDVVGFTKVTRDLTERKKAEDQQAEYTRNLAETNEALRRSEERYHKMVEEVRDYAILLMDKDGNIQNWNKGAENIKGYKSEEIIGKNFRQFYT